MTPTQLLAHFGSIAAAARALNIKPPSVSQWVAAGEIPIDRQCQIELLTAHALLANRNAAGAPVKSDRPHETAA